MNKNTEHTKFHFSIKEEADKFEVALFQYIKKRAKIILEPFFVHTEYEGNKICKCIRFPDTQAYQGFICHMQKTGYAYQDI